MLTKNDVLDEVLATHEGALGADYDAYANHCYRVLNLCHLLGTDDPDGASKVAIATAFHDLGIWTDRTFDYLVPSAKLAVDYLARHGKQGWTAEIEAMVLEHHKVTAVAPSAPSALVETFRRADWVDVTFGLRAFGLSRDAVRAIYRTFPDHGFHGRLVQLTLERFFAYPTSPLPMFHW